MFELVLDVLVGQSEEEGAGESDNGKHDPVLGWVQHLDPPEQPWEEEGVVMGNWPDFLPEGTLEDVLILDVVHSVSIVPR